jgi:16S rRNA (uracil1498-N3)-methyltransferase
MSSRYFAPVPPDARSVVLAGTEAHHLLHVMRTRVGDRVTLFDGHGFEYEAEVTSLGRSEIELRIESRTAIDREARIECVLAVALPKGDRQTWLAEKAVELGVARLVPLETTRGVAQPVDKALERLRRTVIEAAKQCGRNRLMEIAPAAAWAEFVAGLAAGEIGWLADPTATVSARDAALELAQSTPARLTIAVGPEGGLTDEETALARAAGWQPISLGPRILRVETAAITLAGLAIALSDRTDS